MAVQLKENYDFIVKHLDADDVIDELIQEGLMGTSASQRVQLTGQSRKNKNRIIYDQLVTSGPGSLEKFCKILRNGKRQSFIAEQLEKGLFIDNVVAICYLWFFVASFSLYLLNYRSY